PLRWEEFPAASHSLSKGKRGRSARQHSRLADGLEAGNPTANSRHAVRSAQAQTLHEGVLRPIGHAVATMSTSDWAMAHCPTKPTVQRSSISGDFGAADAQAFAR